MGRKALTLPLLAVLAALAILSLVYSVRAARHDSADLERRAREVSLFLRGEDPYLSRDMTYPPSAPPVFAALLAFSGESVRRNYWLCLNFGAMIAILSAILTGWGRAWPTWIKIGFGLAVAASKPTRAGIALGQFHLIPVALILWSERALLAGWDRFAGFLVGIALIKPTMAAPYVALLVVRRQFRALGMATAVQVLLMSLTATWVHVSAPKLVQEWLAQARNELSAGTIDVPSILIRIFPENHPSPTFASVVVLAISCVLLYVNRKRSSFGLTCLSLYMASVMTYHRHYDLVLLLPTLAYFLDRGYEGADSRAGWFAILFGFALVVPSQASLTGVNGEWLYDRMIILIAYIALGYLLYLIMSERQNNPDSELSDTEKIL